MKFSTLALFAIGLLAMGGCERRGFTQQELMDAAALGQLSVVKNLLDRGADPNYMDSELEKPPLYCALMNRHEDVALLLVERGAKAKGIADNSSLIPRDRVTAGLLDRLLQLESRSKSDHRAVD